MIGLALEKLVEDRLERDGEVVCHILKVSIVKSLLAFLRPHFRPGFQLQRLSDA
jgi:hypothetical protein